MTDGIHNLLSEQTKLLGKEMAEAEDRMFFMGELPEWAKAPYQPLTFWDSLKILKMRFRIFVMEKTRNIRWKIADKVAPDIHEHCDY